MVNLYNGFDCICLISKIMLKCSIRIPFPHAIGNKIEISIRSHPNIFPTALGATIVLCISSYDLNCSLYSI